MSTSFSSSREVVKWRRPSAASRSSAASFPFSTARPMLFSIALLPFWQCSSLTSRTRVSYPARADTSAIPLPMSPHPSTATLRISAISPPPDFRVLQMKPAGIWERVLAGSTPAGEPLFEPAEEPATPIRGRRDERLPVLQPIEEPFDLDAGPGRLLAEMGACDRDAGGDAAAQHSAERDHAGRDRAVGTDQIVRGPAGHGREPTADQGAEDPARYRAASHGVPPLVGKV